VDTVSVASSRTNRRHARARFVLRRSRARARLRASISRRTTDDSTPLVLRASRGALAGLDRGTERRFCLAPSSPAPRLRTLRHRHEPRATTARSMSLSPWHAATRALPSAAHRHATVAHRHTTAYAHRHTATAAHRHTESAPPPPRFFIIS
jgi:hypothetical protein